MAETITAKVALKMPGGTVRAEMTVPTGPIRPEALWPIARDLLGQIIGATVDHEAGQGRAISCRAGCGACCRQLVPIAEAEARRIRDLVASMPEPRLAEISERFARARDRLDEAGLLEKLSEPTRWPPGDSLTVGLAYFRLGIACPFLEEESCSIHPDRPLACREYLVTSPPEFCARMEPGTVAGVKLPTSVWSAFAKLDPPADDSTTNRWVPLILATDWADSHPDSDPPRPGPELLHQFIETVAKAEGTLPRPGIS